MRLPGEANVAMSGGDEGPVLSVAAMTVRFGDRIVLNDVSFEVAPGRIVVVLGPNGAGKSTLLRCVLGAQEAEAGRVLLDGEPLDETDPGVRAAVAAALDDLDVFPDLSVSEHLELLAFAHGGGEVDEVLAELGLAEARDQLPATLSSGQRRRLALASCFVRPRRLLVLDEPEQRLDTRGRRWLVERLLREKERGTAVLMASHDPEVYEAVADQRIEL